MVLSSIVLLYKLFESISPALQFIAGKGINNYLINIIIVGLYVRTYWKLTSYYKSLRVEHANYLSTFDNEQITNTLKMVGIFFVAIIQCFIYRIFMYTMIDSFPEIFYEEDGKTANSLYNVLISFFYFSETLMICGMCISIRQSILTATSKHEIHSGDILSSNKASNDLSISEYGLSGNNEEDRTVKTRNASAFLYYESLVDNYQNQQQME